MFKLLERLPPPLGENMMPMEQLVDAARLAPQLLLEMAKSIPPVIEILVIVSVPVPVLVRATFCAALDVPTS